MPAFLINLLANEAQYLPIILSQKLDEGVLSRFWSSLNQPLKPAVQCWTTVAIYPGGAREIKRVTEKDVRFFDLNRIGAKDRCLGLFYLGYPANAAEWPQGRRRPIEEKIEWVDA